VAPPAAPRKKRPNKGRLTLETAAIDQWLRVAVAGEPFLCNYPVAITAPKPLHVYPDLMHTPCTDFNAHAMHWLRRYFGA
jgi:hypothetical protein